LPAEQALTEARKRLGPSYGDGDASLAWRARLEESAALIAPLALIVGLALAGGGFALSERHIAGLAVWLIVVAMLALGAGSRAALGRPFQWAAGLIGSLALFSAISSLWSGSVELSVIEADRVLVYLGVFLASFLIAQTDKRRQRFAEGIALALILVALLGLCSRLLPDILSVTEGQERGARLLYPLGYWNADGVAFGIAAALILWMSRHSLTNWLRWATLASLPAVLLALYFTYSRGGLLSLLIAGGCLLILSRDRLWLLATLAVGVLGALPAVLAVQSRHDLAEGFPTEAASDQGLIVLLILAAGTAVTMLVFAGLRRLERRGGGLTGRALELSRNPTVLKRIALAVAVVAIGAAVAVGGRAWDRFSSSDLQVSNPQERITDFSGAGRKEFWRVALDAFGEEPLVGHGAGTYRFSWDQLRRIPMPVLDAHSLYLQALAELGIVGGALTVGVVLVLLWAGLSAWRAAIGAQRELYAALLAAALAFAVGAAIDWFWEIAAMGTIFFLATGALVAGRCAQLARGRAAGDGLGDQRRFGLTVAGLAVAWITALALIGPLLVDREINASKAAAADHNVPAAIDHAETARSIEPWAASPYVQLGLIAQLEGDFSNATARMSEAIDREDHNWVLYYLRAKIEEEAGETAAARADIREAERLNPQEECLREGFEGCG
jgi:hypothetical protein